MLRVVPFFILIACTSNSPTGSVCPTSDAPTYGSFGETFFTTYCTDCHSATSRNRHGAPGDVNLDTIDDIRSHADDIDLESASGPKATNTDMPELDTNVPTAPTMAEREMLGEFIACVKAGNN
ncbi:MAG TPA: hypothetical protein VGC41_06115 [Kofleriaceae bacterium]